MTAIKLALVGIFLSLQASAQLNSNTLIGMGNDAGNNLLAKMKQKKQNKAIENSLTQVQIDGVTVSMLRVSADKITSNAKSYIVSIQSKLDGYYNQYKNNQHIRIGYEDDIAVIKNMDAEWPGNYYSEELRAYSSYDAHLTQLEQQTRDSIAAVKAAADKQRAADLAVANKKMADSAAYTSRVAGFHFVSKEAVSLKEKPHATSQSLGRLYKGSYIKVLGYSETSSFVKIALDNIEGFVDRGDIVADLNDINATETELAHYKSRHYYKYEPNFDYVAPVQKVYAAPAPVEEEDNNVRYSKPAAKKATTRSSGGGRNYMTGPRGGCYYINSSGNKTYVDHSYCK